MASIFSSLTLRLWSQKIDIAAAIYTAIAQQLHPLSDKGFRIQVGQRLDPSRSNDDEVFIAFSRKGMLGGWVLVATSDATGIRLGKVDDVGRGFRSELHC
jgi:hypothetical protein